MPNARRACASRTARRRPPARDTELRIAERVSRRTVPMHYALTATGAVEAVPRGRWAQPLVAFHGETGGAYGPVDFLDVLPSASLELECDRSLGQGKAGLGALVADLMNVCPAAGHARHQPL